MQKLIIATRGSKLALWQSNHIKSVLQQQNPGLEVELKIIVTMGDKILDKPLAAIGGKGLFLKELEEAMLRGEAHIAVHSLKDVPTALPQGFVLAAITQREDARDVLLSQKYADIDALPQGAVVGTSSLRRRMQIQKLRPDLTIKNLRGNVDTRINKMKSGEFDAIILASAGMNRLGLRDSVQYAYNIPLEQMIPSMGQGALGIEAIDDPEVVKIAGALQDEQTMIATMLERSFVDVLEGGCQVPIGANAQFIDDEKVILRTVLGMPDASQVMQESVTIERAEYKTAGRILGETMIQNGAKALLERAEAMASQMNSKL
jgi:hydroxymethylbilane synthase